MFRKPSCIIRRIALAGVITLALSNSVDAAPSSNEIDQAVRDLSSERFDVREKGSQTLFSAGLSAMPVLRRAARDDDPEVRSRAERILDRFAHGIFPDTPKDVTDLAERYQEVEGSEKHTILTELSRKGGYGYVVLAKLAEEEQDLWLAGLIRQILVAESAALPQTAALLLQREDHAAAERLLATGAEAGNEIAIRAYAALLRDEGKLAVKSAELQARLDRGEAEGVNLARELAFLYRAAGDLDRAIAVAEKSGEAALVQTLALERHDWKKLAASFAVEPTTPATEMRRLTLLASTQRLSGDSAAFEKTIAEIQARFKTSPGVYWPVATALLLNDRVDEAVRLLIDQKRYATAFEFDAFAGKFDEALALLPRAKAEGHPEVPRLAAMTARLLWRLGNAAEAKTLLNAAAIDAMADGTEANRFTALATLAEVEREVGHTDAEFVGKAREHLLGALKVAKPTDDRQRLFDGMYPGRGIVVGQWWSTLAPPSPSPDTLWNGALDIVDHLFAGKMTADEWTALGLKLDGPATAPGFNALRMRRLELLIDALDSAGQSALSERYFDRLREVFAWAHDVPRDIYLFVPRWHLRHKQWLAAVETCEICAAKMGYSSDVLWLRGWALHQAGQIKDGDALMEQATHRTLGDDRAMAALADLMTAYEHGADSLAIRRDISRLGTPRGLLYYDNCRFMANDLAGRDPGAAAELWHAFALVVPDLGAKFQGELAYLEIPRFAHYQEARSLYQHGRVPEAMAAFREMLARAPVSIEFITEAVPELKTLGQETAARELFDAVYRPLRDLCAKYPDSGHLRNEIAWLAVKCGYELEAASVDAERSVELRPRDTSGIDTLAEIYYRLGNREKAVGLMKQCEVFEPNQARHGQRRAEFEK